jgi:hypothetical protein
MMSEEKKYTIGDKLEALQKWLDDVDGAYNDLLVNETPVGIVYTACKEIVTLRARNSELEALYTENEERCNQYLVAMDVADSKAKELEEALMQEQAEHEDTSCVLQTRIDELGDEVERLRDAELIAWGLANNSRDRSFPLIWHHSPDISGCRWHLKTDQLGASIHLEGYELPILNDTARAWLTAAMTAWREKGGK